MISHIVHLGENSYVIFRIETSLIILTEGTHDGIKTSFALSLSFPGLISFVVWYLLMPYVTTQTLLDWDK